MTKDLCKYSDVCIYNDYSKTQIFILLFLKGCFNLNILDTKLQRIEFSKIM